MRRLGLAAIMLALMPALAAGAEGRPVKFARYSHAGRIAYGILDGDVLRELGGNFLAGGKPTGKSWFTRMTGSTVNPSFSNAGMSPAWMSDDLPAPEGE